MKIIFAEPNVKVSESCFLFVEGKQDDAKLQNHPCRKWRAAFHSTTSDKHELNIKPVNVIRFSLLCSDKALSSVKCMNTETEEQREAFTLRHFELI